MISTHDIEEWRPAPISGYENIYEVSSFGRIRRIVSACGGQFPAGMMLKPFRTPKGYLMVDLRHEGRRFTKQVHSLVLLAFVGIRPDDYEACHYDGVKTNNHLSNLKWGTRLDNAADRIRLGTTTKGRFAGSNHWGAKLKEIEVTEIRRLWLEKKHTQPELGKQFGVTKCTIQDIVYRKTWKHLPKQSG